MQHWKTFGTWQMQAHIYSSTQPPKTATAHPWMKKKFLFIEVIELLQHWVSSLITSMYWRFGCAFHGTLQRSTWQRKQTHCKYGMYVLVIKISAMLQKCWSNMVLIWKQTKNFVTGVLGKAHRQSFGARTSRPSIIAEQINADVCGPMIETSVGGVRYYACFEDDYSKFRRVFIHHHKSWWRTVYESFWKKQRLLDTSQKFYCQTVVKN
jgi:hypothetical protein